MSAFDDLQGKAQELIQGNEEAIKGGIEKVGDFIDDKTGGKFEDQVNALQDGASNLVAGLGGK
ncbi:MULTISPECIES: antitoxin [Arthrobacter]|uniref:Antitoxin n=2 Tax=Arthrobacter TaxID=1663 RepID=A0ABU9KG81_9MICC|nr:antitoxin [Arthrobacter sp. YJM1]MDP5225893.1 antitoxin [Arthrobacter sp. YJM1]